MKTIIPLYLIVALLAIISLQNAGIIAPKTLPKTKIYGSVEVEGEVGISHPVEIEGTVPVSIGDPVEVTTGFPAPNVRIQGTVQIEKQP